jgi:hypothetical protein
MWARYTADSDFQIENCCPFSFLQRFCDECAEVHFLRRHFPVGSKPRRQANVGEENIRSLACPILLNTHSETAIKQVCLEGAGHLPSFSFPPFSSLSGLDETSKWEQRK